MEKNKGGYLRNVEEVGQTHVDDPCLPISRWLYVQSNVTFLAKGYLKLGLPRTQLENLSFSFFSACCRVGASVRLTSVVSDSLLATGWEPACY